VVRLLQKFAHKLPHTIDFKRSMVSISSLDLRALTMVAATPIPTYAYCSSAVASAASRVFIFINLELWYYTGITGAVSVNLSSLLFFSNFTVILSNVVRL